MRLSALTLAALFVVGCNSPTTLLLDVKMGAGEAPPPSLLINLYDAFGPLAVDQRIKQPPPGRIVVIDLPTRSQTVRVVVRGMSDGQLRLGATSITTKPSRQATGAIELRADTIDSDGDQVPDSVDNCPTTVNTDQIDQTGTGIGDVCNTADLSRPADDASTAPSDLTAVDPDADLAMTEEPMDLALDPPDLTALDFSLSDLTHLPDLKPPSDLATVADLRATGCAASTRHRCEDFEAATIDTRWNVSQTNATVSLVTASTGKVHSGTRALRIAATGNAAGFSGGIGDSDLVTGLAGGFYVRAWVYLVGPGVDYAQIGEAGPSSGGVGNLLVQDQRKVTFQDYGYSTELYKQSTQTLPLDQWFCLEWRVQRGATQAQGAMRAYFGGTEITSAAVSPANVAAMDTLFLGYTTDRTTAATVYMDDLIVDDSGPIGCTE